jgi:hypothetical protein
LSASNFPCSETFWGGTEIGHQTLHLPRGQLSLGVELNGTSWRALGAQSGGSFDNTDRNYGRTFDGIWDLANDADRIATTGTGEVPRKSGSKFARATSKRASGMAESDHTNCAIFITETAGDEELGGTKSRRSPHLHRRTCVREDVTGGTSGAGCDGAFCGSLLRLFRADNVHTTNLASLLSTPDRATNEQDGARLRQDLEEVCKQTAKIFHRPSMLLKINCG